MKKILLLMIFATLSWQHVLAQNFTYGGITYNVTSATTVEVIYQGGGVSGNVTIPAQVADGNIDYSVTSIGNSAFYNSPNLTVVTIPNTVTSIGASAFQFCSGLTSVNIPDLVTSIGNSAFSNCSSLTSIALPNSVTSIGTFAFSRCSGLTSVTMSNNLVSIPAGAFFSCTSLPAITIASTVESIGANAFGICYNLRSVICNRATPPAVSENSFSGWNQFLCSLTVPAGSVAAYQAASVWQIFSPIVCSGAIDNTTTISACGSYNWVHNNQTYTSSGVYSGSTTNCVTEKLELTITTPPTSFSYNNLNYVVTGTNTVAVGINSGASGAVTIPATVTNACGTYDVTSIGQNAFNGCSGITSVTIPSSVWNIGNSAFKFCSGLTSVTIPTSVTLIDNNAFQYSGLLSIAIPNSVTAINPNAFSYCQSLTSLTIPNSVTAIHAFAFLYCYNLTSITIPSSVIYIGEYAFNNCSGLTSVTCNLTQPLGISANVFGNVNTGACSLTVPPGSVAAYQDANVWQNFAPITAPCSPSDSTTTVSACGSYTWAHDGLTYNESGTYTGSTTDCVTQKLDLTITPAPAAPTASAQTLCNGATVENLSATGSGIKWYAAATGGEALAASTALATGTYYVSQTSGICESARPAVSVTITPAPAAPTLANTSTSDIVVSITGNCQVHSGVYRYKGLFNGKNQYQWTQDSDFKLEYIGDRWSLRGNFENITDSSGLFAPTTGWVSKRCGVGSLTYSFINPPQTFCAGATIANLDAIGDNLKWYDVATGGIALGTSTVLVAGNYYVSQTIDGCESGRTLVPVMITPSTDLITSVTSCGSYSWDGSTYTESGTYTGSTTDCVTQKLDLIITTRTTPTFTPVASICSGATLSDLPSISNEGITGTWAPALNNLATTTYTFTPEAGQCAATASMTIVVNPTIAPTFSPVATICSGATLANLPTTSINEIVGNWSPEVSNTETKTYTFTPNEGQCGETSTLTITVTPSVTPTFNAVESICTGGVLSDLPTTSNNGITGTWSPELSNVATKTYTFTPTADQCAIATTLTITVNPIVTPTFVAIGAICQGQSLQPLPTTSTNGITGNWSYSPTLSNVASKTYTFTPALGQCAIGTTLTITVNPTVIPTFTAVAPICSGATDAALPIASNNGIAGTWSPAFSNTATTTYTFAANPGQCASTTNPTLKITVKPKTTPIFKQVSAVCLGATIADLPSTSLNAVTGSWSPAIDNTTTTTYTFTPTDAVCNNGTTMTITVKPVTTPTFTQVAPICWAGTISGLNLTSSNGVTGSWSPAQNSAATTTYTFTPTAGLCANKTEMTIIVIPKTKPTFNPVTAVCSGATLNPLPTTSNNLFTGTWSPALDNSVSKTYTFTPTVGQCASIAILRITVNPKTTPTFTQVAAICPGATLAALPTTSNNFFTGTWSPDLDTSVTKTYTFTPSANQCASTKTMTIVVNNTAPGTITGGNVAVCFPGTGLNTNDVSTNFTNSTTLTLNGNSVGSTIQWQRSLNATSASPSWTTFANATTTNNGILINGNTLTVSNLTSTTWYRARVTNGTCFIFTEPTKITVNPSANAGTVTSETSVCAFNSITFTSSAYIGSAIAWEVSTATATTGFITVAGQTGSTYVMTSAPPATFYVRSVVTSGCSIERSIAKKIKVISASTPGKIRGGGTVCLGSNKQLTITGNFGTIQWMYSTNGTNFMNVPTAGNGVATTFSTTSTSSSASSYAVNNITGTTFFKALVTNGSCSSLETNVVKYSVATAATAGTADAEPPFVCVGNGTTITLTNFAGDIIWQKASSSTAANPTWTAITGAVNPILSTGNLTTATKYRASVTIGTCAPVVTSNPIVITLISCATTSKQIAAPSEIAEPFSVVAYPNPSNNVFNFKVNVANDDDVSMLVFDMMGRQIENKVVKANDIENITLGQNYASGVYNVIVSQGMNTKTVRLVKK